MKEINSIIKKALIKIQDLTAENLALRKQMVINEPIAIVGVGCRFPGEINTLESFWDLLCANKDVITTEVRSEFTHKKIARSGGFLSDPYQFAIDFFDISRREAQSLDPQQRLLLEVVWEAFEHAAIKPSDLANTQTGVFVGVIGDDYSQLMLQSHPSMIDPYFASGNAHSTAAGRLSHWFDFKGPCLAIDTACSSSLVALHLACQSLQRGECEVAVVAAANCLLNDVYYECFSRAGMLADDGYCKVFDEQANGYVRSEGCAALIIKPLSKAKMDGDDICGVIKGSAINHDGHCSALTVPSGPQQQAVIENALLSAGIDFNDLSYIEAHGTGTALGDPIELKALGNLCHKYTRSQPLLIGSVKANMGHLEAAAGMAGLIKTILCLKEGSVPQQIHFNQPSSRIDWSHYPLVVPTTQQFFSPMNNKPLRAGISSFGFSGTNAHIILEKYEYTHSVKKNIVRKLPFILQLSAKRTDEFLQQLRNFLTLLEAIENVENLYDICLTANSGREIFSYTIIFISTTLFDMRTMLSTWLNKISTNPQHIRTLQIIADHQEFDTKNLIDLDKTLSATYVGLPSFVDMMNKKINWHAYYADVGAKKCRLPSYPFSKERIAFTHVNSHDEILYEVVWQPLEFQAEAFILSEYSWMIYHPNHDIPPELTAQWEQQNKPWISVCSHQDLQIALDNSDPTSHIGLVFYYDSATDISLNIKNSLIVLNQLITCVNLCVASKRQVYLWLILAGKQNSPILEISAITGAYKSLTLEYPELMLGCLYYQNHYEYQPDFFALLNYAKNEMQIKINEGSYFVPRISRYGISSYLAHMSLPLTAAGVYVITGSNGGIGMHLISWLISLGVKSIALLSRSQPNSSIQELIAKYSFATIIHFSVDVTEKDALFLIFDDIQASFGPIKGVFHAAGIAEYRACTEINDAYLQKIFLPKVAGALHIASYFKHHPVDFIIHFGSIAAVWGAAKMIPYAAANSCLEEITIHAKHHYIIHFGPWQETGMAKQVEEVKRTDSGLLPIVVADALAALSYSASIKRPYVASSMNWSQFTTLYQLHRSTNLFNLLVIDTPPSLARINQPAQTILDLKIMQSMVAKILSSPVTHIDVDQPLQEMGLDSIMTLEFITQLQGYVVDQLSATLIFKYPTLRQLFTFLSEGELNHSLNQIPIASANMHDAVAIIGVSCRVGECETPAVFWEKLLAGHCFIQPNIATKLAERAGISSPINDIYSGNLLQNVYGFDAALFRISPKEACLIDPAQRLMLQLAWHAFESAGYDILQLKESDCGVYIGVGNNEYASLCRQYMDKKDELFYPTSQALNLIAGRISYFFGLQGPSLVIDTACSSSLMAVHQACQSLRHGETNMALAGGINLIFSLEGMHSLSQAKMLSSTGHCRPFDNTADGYVRAEAAGLVLLKRLADAKRDGDPILAVIESSAANQDGQSASLTAPSVQSQQAVMQKALALTSYTANDIDFIEAHATGTSLGDPIECESVIKVYVNGRKDWRPFFVNSIKSQIGHAEAAAGILSLIRVLGSIQTGLIPKQYGYEKLNTHIPKFPEKMIIPTKTYDLSHQQKIVGAVSSFGFSGTNVHMIVSGKVQSTIPFQPIKSLQQFIQVNYNVVPENTIDSSSNDFYKTIWEPNAIATWQPDALFFDHRCKKLTAHLWQQPLLLTPLLEDYEEKLAELNRCCLIYFVHALRKLGILSLHSTRISDILLSITPEHHAYVKLLANECQNLGIEVSHLENEPVPLLAHFNHSSVMHEYKLVRYIADELTDILAGKKKSLDVLFPQGDSSAVNTIYEYSPESKWINDLLANTIKQLIQRLCNIDRPIKILEVGAGTGASTAALLSLLENINYEYTYTDYSLSLLDAAKIKFAQYHQLTFKLFDLDDTENLPFAFYQGFDLVIAANVLHVSKKIQRSLAILNRCLKNGGILVMLEGTKPVTMLDFIFGLTPGWWSFEDDREGYPLLSIERWQKELLAASFDFDCLNLNRLSGQVIMLGQKQKTCYLEKEPPLLLYTNHSEYAQFISSEAKLYGIHVAAFTEEYSHAHAVICHWQPPSVKKEDLASMMYHFVQMICKKQKSKLAHVPLFIITNNKHSPDQAMWCGAAAVIRVEYPSLKVITIDQDELYSPAIFSELQQLTYQTHVMYRDHLRYSGYIVPCLHHPETNFTINFANTRWIIAGGSGGLALVIVQWLITQGVNEIMLLSRHGLNIANKKMIEGLVKKYSLMIREELIDIADNKAMERLTEKITNEKKLFTGILHLAGVVQDKQIKNINKEDFDIVFKAKVIGTENLVKMGKQLTLSYFIAFSSATAIFGNVGQINHAAANAYLDAYLVKHQQDFPFVLSINWGPWLETGAALKTKAIDHVETAGILPYTNQQGLLAFVRALTFGTNQITAININWNQYQETHAFLSFFDKVWIKDKQNKMHISQINYHYQNYQAVMQTIKTIFAKKLHLRIEDFDDRIGFSNYGVDSLMAISLAHELSSQFKLPFDSTVLFDYPTYEDLAKYIFDALVAVGEKHHASLKK